MLDVFLSAVSHVWWAVVVYMGTVQIHNGLVQLGNAIIAHGKLVGKEK